MTFYTNKYAAAFAKIAQAPVKGGLRRPTMTAPSPPTRVKPKGPAAPVAPGTRTGRDGAAPALHSISSRKLNLPARPPAPRQARIAPQQQGGKPKYPSTHWKSKKFPTTGYAGQAHNLPPEERTSRAKHRQMRPAYNEISKNIGWNRNTYQGPW